MKKINQIFLLSLTLVLVVLVPLFLTKPSKAVSFTFSPAKLTLKQGKTLETSVVLGGPESQLKKVTVIDIKVNYDKSKLKIVSATPGSFFKYPWIVKSDKEEGFFSLAINPNNKGEISLNSSNQAEILKIKFQAIGATSNVKISFDDKISSVYISKTGTPKMMFSSASVHIN